MFLRANINTERFGSCSLHPFPFTHTPSKAAEQAPHDPKLALDCDFVTPSLLGALVDIVVRPQELAGRYMPEVRYYRWDVVGRVSEHHIAQRHASQRWGGGGGIQGRTLN